MPLQKVSDSCCHALSLQKSDQSKNGVLPLYPDRSRPVLTFQPCQSSKVSTLPCGWWNIFHLTTPSHYFLIFMADVQVNKISPVQTFIARTHHVMYTWSTCLHSFCIPFVKRKFHLDSFIPRTVTLWNRFPKGCFLVLYNLNVFKFRF